MPSALHAGFSTHWTEAGLAPAPAVPRVLLLHCALAHARAWDGMAAQLGDAARVCAMDLPGHGQSAPLDPQYTAQEQGALMAWPLIEAMGGKVDLVGHSLGGTLALRLALERPGAVRSLTLIEPVQFSLLREAGHPLAAPHFEAEARLAALIASGRAEEAARGFLSTWGDGPPWEALPPARRAYVLERLPMIVGHARAMAADRVGPVTLAGLAGLQLPVLLIDGAQTPPVIGAIHDVLEGALPKVRRLSVPGAGHMVPLTHPAAVAAVLREHLGAAPLPAGA